MKKRKKQTWIKMIKTPAYWGILLLLIGCGIYKIRESVPDTLQINENDKAPYDLLYHNPWLTIDETMAVSTSDSYTVTCKLWNIIPLKTVTVSHAEEMEVEVSGKHIGIYIDMDGVLVIDLEDVRSINGETSCPAEKIIKKGDYIRTIDGREITKKEELIDYMENSNGEAVLLGVNQDGVLKEVSINPVCTQDGTYKLGLWVRDNTQGIGTITYITEDGHYGALGHGISDGDTGRLVSVKNGGIYKSKIISIQKGSVGEPGELQGVIQYGDSSYMGSIENNTECGIFGEVEDERREKLKTSQYPIGFKQELRIGEASVFCTTEEGTKEYAIEIESIHWSPNEVNKCFEIRVTDEQLIEKTGGIVQGLSGSPIIQDGKLVGAVTHVLVNDPTRGYGIFIENMLQH